MGLNPFCASNSDVDENAKANVKCEQGMNVPQTSAVNLII